MGIQQQKRSLHWDYYLTLEEDLKNLARYVDFDKANYNVFSIELVRILQIASSEVDVVLKLLCKKLDLTKEYDNIRKYRKEIMNSWPRMVDEKVYSHRYGLTLHPWKNWVKGENPEWWEAYNHVKHKRNKCYKEANLKNTLNAVAALLICTSYYYLIATTEGKDSGKFKDLFNNMSDGCGIYKLNESYYYSKLIV